MNAGKQLKTIAVIVMLVGVELAKGSLDKLLNPAPVEFSAALVAGWCRCVQTDRTAMC